MGTFDDRALHVRVPTEQEPNFFMFHHVLKGFTQKFIDLILSHPNRSLRKCLEYLGSFNNDLNDDATLGPFLDFRVMIRRNLEQTAITVNQYLKLKFKLTESFRHHLHRIPIRSSYN